MVTTYKTREEKELAVIRALKTGLDDNAKMLFLCKKEQSFHDINEVSANFIFSAIENPNWVVKKFKRGD